MNLPELKTPLWGDDIPYVAGLREKAGRILHHSGFPSAKTEAWKYAHFDISSLSALQINTDVHHCDHDNCTCHRQPLPFSCYRLEFCDGQFLADHSDTIPGVYVKPLIEALFDGETKTYLNKSFPIEKYPFAALNTLYLEQGFMMIIERNTVLDQPIYISYHQSKSGYLNNMHNLILCESGSQAAIIEHFHCEQANNYCNNIVNEIKLSAAAKLTHYVFENESVQSHHIELNSIRQKENSSYQAFCLKKSGGFSRHESLLRLEQKEARAEVNGIYRVNGSSVSDITTDIYHLAPETFSDQLVKGVATDHGKAVFQGKIHIAPNAQKTEGHQTHHALLLSDTAEIDSKPELEIFADDVKCSHGSSCGDLDPEQLFYMQTRGFSQDDARHILIQAHLNEVLEKINHPIIKEWLKDQFF